jgi:anthranilate phosphoribosyltransferase
MLDTLEILYDQNDLSQTQSEEIFSQVMQGKVSEIALTALLTALKIKGETPQEIAGAAQAMVSNATAFPRPDRPFADIVGTGGDGYNTINISSAAAVVAASCGIAVAKHGNRSVSSQSGSADLFNAFGYNLMHSPEQARATMNATNLCFLFAPVYHAGVKHAMPVRTELKTRTIFNVLGPLANPARPTHSVMGVYTPELLLPYAQTLQLLGHERVLVVHGSGLDEFALHGETQVVEINAGTMTEYVLKPADFGLESAPLEAIVGGTPEQNKAAIEAVFNGKGEPAHTHAIAMNAGALLYLCGKAQTYAEGAQIALTAIAEGKPMQTITQAAQLSQETL